MNKRIGRLGAVFAGAFLVLIINLTYLQFIAASELSAKAENVRPLLNEQKIKRGDIVSADGALLAASRKDDNGSYKRYYPQGKLAASVTGFYSTKYGRAGLELTHDEYLTGQTKLASIDDYMLRLLGKDAPGNTLELTLDMRLQEAAKKALGSKKGAIVVLNPRTGAVLALVGAPTYDPNEIDAAWKDLSKDTGGALVNRPLNGKFTPGSSFKIISAAAALEDGAVTTDTAFDAPDSVKIYGGKVTNYENKDYGDITFAEAFTKSVNTVFAQIGKGLGRQKLVEAAESFGFNEKVPFDVSAAGSYIPDASQIDELEVAWTAVGQGRIQATPLQMALVVAAIANDGKMMRPYLVEKIREHDGEVVFAREPGVWLTPVSQKTAQTLTSMMVSVVNKGTGRAARISSVQVAGKTGTAEVGQRPPHAWFVGFAPADKPQVAVAVVVENGGIGGAVAAPIARQVIQSALGKQR